MDYIKRQSKENSKIAAKYRGWYKADSGVWGDRYMKEKHGVLTEKRDIKEVNIILKYLPKHCEKILDAPCGYGRISNILADKGFDVTGIDISKYFVNIAKKAANEKKLKVKYEVGNILKKRLAGKFDAVLNIFTSIGYLESDRENELFIKRLCDYVKTGGRLIIETINPIFLLSNYQSKDSIIKEDGTKINFERFYDINTATNITRVKETDPNGKIRTLVHTIRLYYPHELINICEKYGCRLVFLLNQEAQKKNIINSYRIWLIFQKK